MRIMFAVLKLLPLEVWSWTALRLLLMLLPLLLLLGTRYRELLDGIIDRGMSGTRNEGRKPWNEGCDCGCYLFARRGPDGQ